MCVRIKLNGRLISQGQTVQVSSDQQAGEGKWVGFAREETLEATWNGWVPVDVQANDFAEHNRPASRVSGTRVLTWGSMDKGKIISGIGNRNTGEIRVITREATEDEYDVFGHARMPIVLDSRF